VTLKTESINGDLSQPVAMDTTLMDWSASPSGSVWRKRMHLVGPPESGQVTSVVKYEPESQFPAHDHPAGEEILVLGGVFSDEHGDWPAGSYLLNPEGFRHAPYSRSGCEIFVKLRQSPGLRRKHVSLDTGSMEWQEAGDGQEYFRTLYSQDGFSDVVKMVKWMPVRRRKKISRPGGAEIFVLGGEFTDEHGTHGAGCWLRLPSGAHHTPGSESGCVFYVKVGGFSYLDSE
jgi:anti-sigma factor ChrR (cupin superfamily)